MNKFFDIHRYDVAGSTNDIAKRMAQEGRGEGFVAIAREQTAGRGRMGRAFFSPGGCGLYMSVLLRPHLSPGEALRITTMTAVAVCEAIEGYCGTDARIKWTNDVVAGGKKVCGILTESGISRDDRLDYAVVGLGLNILSPPNGYPEDIRNKAGALYVGQCPDTARDDIAQRILERLHHYYTRLHENEYVSKYKARCATLGSDVEIVVPNGVNRFARAVDITDDCALVVEFDGGEKAVLSSGEVIVRYEYE
ncbi:MAG: biotin--[acetyl-CoA-carboxylase] ligase [Clostridia bacterium]|nr:biotin--[acetyl-CoA-carboxylase] ligase [Clostridia bacterium]